MSIPCVMKGPSKLNKLSLFVALVYINISGSSAGTNVLQAMTSGFIVIMEPRSSACEVLSLSILAKICKSISQMKIDKMNCNCLR